jgi:hypothetical protein
MKKGLIVAALAAAAVAMPATSNADSSEKSSARGGPDLTITFDLLMQGNDPVRIKNFKFKNFTAPCTVSGPTEIKGTISKIGLNNKEKFDAVAKTNDGKGKVIVEGQVKRHGKKTVGTLKAKGDFAPAEDCNAKIEWKAS